MGFPSPKIEYHLPPLDDLFANNMANVSLERLFGGPRGPVEYPYFNMWMNLVRLTDLSIRQYETSRKALDAYREGAYEHRLSPFYDAINGLEETVVATYRATLNSKRLEPVIPHRLLEPTKRQAQLLKQVRHHIQHMDEKLERGAVRQGEIHLLAPTTKSLVIGPKQLHYRDLASVITKMYRNIEIIRQAPSK